MADNQASSRKTKKMNKTLYATEREHSDNKIFFKKEGMSAVLLTGTGSLRCVEARSINFKTTLESEDVVIEIYNSGLGFEDLRIAMGVRKPPVERKYPTIMGTNCVGKIALTGDKVQDLVIGDRVIAFPEAGGWAEYVEAHQNLVIKLPEQMTFPEAAGLLSDAIISRLILFETVDLKQNQSILINSVSGGIGHALAQSAKTQTGIFVFGACSNTKLDIISEWDEVDHILDRNENYCKKVKSFVINYR